MRMNELTSKIKQWMFQKGLDTKLDKWVQLGKVMEELGELASCMIRGDIDGIKDAIGDVYVTIVILAQLCGLQIEECVHHAWNEISDRRGVTIEGSFIKLDDLESVILRTHGSDIEHIEYRHDGYVVYLIERNALTQEIINEGEI